MEVLTLLTDSLEDEGPFFDLEFAFPLNLNMNTSSSLYHKPFSSSSSSSFSLTEEFFFTLKSSSSLFFSPNSSESNSKPATKLRVFMFRSGLNNKSNYKEVLLRCISKIKPLYVKVIKMRFLGVEGRRKQSKEKVRVLPRSLKKSRSASSAVRRKQDDSLLQQEDGIQGAIAHCKRSFHSEKGIWDSESSLIRSMSDPGEDRSAGRGRVRDICGENSAIS